MVWPSPPSTRLRLVAVESLDSAFSSSDGAVVWSGSVAAYVSSVWFHSNSSPSVVFQTMALRRPAASDRLPVAWASWSMVALSEARTCLAWLSAVSKAVAVFEVQWWLPGLMESFADATSVSSEARVWDVSEDAVERDGGHRGIAVLVQCGGRGRGPDVAVRIVGDRSAFHAGDGLSVELAPPRGHGVGAAGVARGEGHVAVVDPLAERQAWILGRIVDGGRVSAGDFQADTAVVAQCRIVGADVQGGAVRRGQRELAVEHAGVERP